MTSEKIDTTLLQEVVKQMVDSDTRNLGSGFFEYKNKLYELYIEVRTEDII